MEIKRIYNVFFSPCGGTKAIVSSLSSHIIEEFPLFEVKSLNYDFTLPSNRSAFPHFDENDLVIFGCPTYAGRLPNLLLPFLNTIDGNGALAICTVSFGNRHFDNSLAELCSLLNEKRFHILGAGAFSAFHVFSTSLGSGRPDEKDFEEIRSFSKELAKKFRTIIQEASDKAVQSPGSNLLSRIEAQKNGYFYPNFVVSGTPDGPYYKPQDSLGNFIDIRKVKPLTASNCTNCGLCAGLCPMGSIDNANFSIVSGICIKCCACVRMCPHGSKYFDDAGYLLHKTDLENKYARRADNSIFL